MTIEPRTPVVVGVGQATERVGDADYPGMSAVDLATAAARAALQHCAAVAEVCVIGTPDEKWGEAVSAVIVLRPDQPGDDAAIATLTAGIRAMVKERKGSVQSPKQTIVVDSVPTRPRWARPARRRCAPNSGKASIDVSVDAIPLATHRTSTLSKQPHATRM